MSGNGGTSRPAGVDSGARRFNIGVNALAFAGLIVVALLIINYLSTKAYGRFDLTEDKLYTLSASSKKLVSKLPRAVKVKMFVSEKLLPGKKLVSRVRKLRSSIAGCEIPVFRPARPVCLHSIRCLRQLRHSIIATTHHSLDNANRWLQ